MAQATGDNMLHIRLFSRGAKAWRSRARITIRLHHVNTHRIQVALLAALFAISIICPCRAEVDFERPPIEYSKSTPHNRVANLISRLDSGQQTLDFDKNLGYLPALLKAMDIPISSQMLVFSKTSLQRARISPRTPRAIYFSDDAYIGYCRNGDVLEVAAVDPQLGTVFYTVDQKKPEAAHIIRQTENCLVCHSSSRSESVPGLLARSLFTSKSGEPILSAGGYTVDYTTPLEHRWGGWYVTGTHGKQKHLGNLVVAAAEVREPVDNAAGQNITALDDRFATDHYLSPHSDIVALMVLEHQSVVHNRITRANFEARSALHYEAEINRALGEPATNRLESVTHRIHNAGDKLVDALLFVDEVPLTDEIHGTSAFADEFSQLGPRDSEDRSLRDFDLKARLMKYPCSYLIYSPSFDALPDEMRAYVWQRLWGVLSGTLKDARFDHLTPADRQAIAEIIQDTKPSLPTFWKPTTLTND